MKIIIISIAMLLLSCTRTIYVPQVSSRTQVDTVTQIIGDSSVIRALFECDSNNRVILRELTETKGKMASQDVNIADGKIEVVTRWQTKYIDRIREVHDTATVVQVQEVVKTVKHVPQFFWWCFGIALVAVGWIARKIIKLF